MSPLAFEMRDIHDTAFLSNYAADILHVKSLFAARKYRRCAILCDELYKKVVRVTDRSSVVLLKGDQKHPALKVFLVFYRAVCYETMGIAAHCYSSNKVPMLEFARDSFSSALTDLEALEKSSNLIQHPTKKDIRFDDFNISPETQIDEQLLPVEARYGNRRQTPVRPQAEQNLSPPDLSSIAMLTRSIKTFSDGPDLTNTPRTPTISSHDDSTATSVYSPCLDTVVLISVGQHRAPLCQSAISHTVEALHQQDLQIEQDGQPLPPLPFNHKPKFEKRGKRMRLTFEQITRPPATRQIIREEALDQIMTPVTPRFNYIARTFAPAQKCRLTMEQVVASSQIVHRNTTLIVHERVHYHLNAAVSHLEEARRLQQEHKADQSRRMVSFWSFKPAETSETAHPKQAAMKERVTRLKANGWTVSKERHGWKGQNHYDELHAEAEKDLRP